MSNKGFKGESIDRTQTTRLREQSVQTNCANDRIISSLALGAFTMIERIKNSIVRTLAAENSCLPLRALVYEEQEHFEAKGVW